jgi:hypothetical protein
MNEMLLDIAKRAGAPKEVIDQLWFHIFCQKFADLLIQTAEDAWKEDQDGKSN